MGGTGLECDPSGLLGGLPAPDTGRQGRANPEKLARVRWLLVPWPLSQGPRRTLLQAGPTVLPVCRPLTTYKVFPGPGAFEWQQVLAGRYPDPHPAAEETETELLRDTGGDLTSGLHLCFHDGNHALLDPRFLSSRQPQNPDPAPPPGCKKAPCVTRPRKPPAWLFDADRSCTCSSLLLRPTVVPMVLITPGLGRAMCPGTEARPGRGL